MKGIVIYYSATGSTAKIAEAIHKGMSEKLESCDIQSVRKADPLEMGKYDIIAIGGPIWYRRETANLRDFIYKMPDMTGKLCVLFCSHGVGADGFMFSISTQVKRKGMQIIGWNNWYGSVYQVMHQFKPYVTDGHPDDVDIAEAKAFGQDMAERAAKVKEGDLSVIQKPDNTNLLWKVQVFEDMHPMDGPGPSDDMPPEMPGGPKFRPAKAVRTFNMDKCQYPTCTKCEDICPVHALSFKEGVPEIKSTCIDCALCDKLCPEEAIELNREVMMQRTQHRINMDKCKYPECTLCADYCPMQSIDFSVMPPVFKKNCEGDDLCWVICPHDAIEVTNLDQTHMLLSSDDPDSPFLDMVSDNEKTGKFRRLVPKDKLDVTNKIMYNPNAPRFVIEHEEP